MDALTEHTKQQIRMNTEAATNLQNDLERAIALLNEITTHAFYGLQAKSRYTAIRLQEIERKARMARNLLETHIWPF